MRITHVYVLFCGNLRIPPYLHPSHPHHSVGFGTPSLLRFRFLLQPVISMIAALELCILAGLVARQLSWAHSSPYGFRMPSSSRGSTFDSGMYTLHLQQPVRHQSVSLAQAHLPCSEPFTARSRTQSLRYLSSHPTYCVTRQCETWRCQISALSPLLSGQRAQKLRAPRL